MTSLAVEDGQNLREPLVLGRALDAAQFGSTENKSGVLA